jgi:subtilisin family serine protease
MKPAQIAMFSINAHIIVLLLTYVTAKQNYVPFSEHNHSSNKQMDYKPGEYIVHMKPGVSLTQLSYSQDFQAMAADDATTILREYHIGDMHSALLEITLDSLGVFSNNPAIESVVPNYRIYAFIDGNQTENNSTNEMMCLEDILTSSKWDLTRFSARDKPASFDNGVYHYSDSELGEGVDIYIVDSGVNINHETFEGRAFHGMTAGGLRASEGDDDLNGHGTHVAGLAAGIEIVYLLKISHMFNKM